MMQYFTIGRIEGIWDNFIPPIQGGKFDLEPEDEGIVIEDSSSDEELVGTVYARKTPMTNDTGESDLPAEFDQYPPLTPEIQNQITLKYRQLEERLWREGYYECHYTRYLPEVVRYTALGLLSYIALRFQYYYTSAIFLGLMWHQLVFTAHDSGHMGITHDPVIDTLIGIFIADYIG